MDQQSQYSDLPPGTSLVSVPAPAGAPAASAAPSAQPSAQPSGGYSDLPPGTSLVTPATGQNLEDTGFLGKVGAAWDAISGINPDDITDPAIRDYFQKAKGGLGMLKSAGQTVHTLSEHISNGNAIKAALLSNPGTAGLAFMLKDEDFHKMGEKLVPRDGVERLGKKTELHGMEEHAGAMAETVLEFMMGEEALKALSVGSRMKTLAPMIEQLEKYPRLMKALVTGIRTGAVGTAQGLAHGDTVGGALETGAVTGVTAGGIEGAGGAISDAITSRQAASAAQREGAAALTAKAGEQAAAAGEARTAATTAADELATAEKNVAGAKAGAPQQIEDMASKAAENVRMTTERGEAPALGGDNARRFPNFGAAAEDAQEAAKPLFAKVDAASKGKYGELRTTLNKAWKARDMAKVDETEHALDELFHMDFGRGMVSEPDALAAREAWRTSKTLEGLHRVVEQAFSGPTEALAERTGVAREFMGGQGMQNRLRALVGKVGQDEIERVIGKDGLDNLVQLADATRTPKQAAQMARVTEGVAKQLERELARTEKAAAANATKAPKTTAGERILFRGARHTAAASIGGGIGALFGGIPGAKFGALAGVGADELARVVWRAATTNPRVGRMLTMAIEQGADPKVYAPFIVHAMAGEELPQQEPNGK